MAAIAGATTKEAIGQPVFAVALVTGIVLLVVFTEILQDLALHMVVPLVGVVLRQLLLVEAPHRRRLPAPPVHALK